MKKKWIIIGVISIIVILVGINILQSQTSTNVKVETTKITEEKMTDTIMIPGTLQLNDEQYVYYEADKGKVVEIFVEEGDTVKKGDPLLRYENNQLDLEKKSNDLQIRSTSIQLENLRKQHREIDKKIAEADKEKEVEVEDFEGFEGLAVQSQGTESKEMLQEEHDQIKLQEQMTGIELEQAQLQKEVIDEQMKALTVAAEVDGTILSVNEKTSMDPMSEQPIIQIGSLKNFVVEGTISEYDTLNVSVGQKAILTSDAVPDEEWEGKVSYVADLPKEQSMMGFDAADSGVFYPLTVTVEDDIQLKPGFKMLIEIIAKEETVKTLPIEAVDQEDDKTYVYLVEDGKAKRVEVEIGSVDTEKMEIISGIEENDEVILSPPEHLEDGMEVTIQ